MNIYLVQHGKPVPKDVDPERPLSEEGINDVEKLASFLFNSGRHAKKILHSGKRRAMQTAEIMASKLDPENQPLVQKGIGPLDDVRPIAEEILRKRENIMIVGHLPNLAKLASFLITGNESPPVVTFQEGGIVCLHYDEEEQKWSIAWMLVPEIIPA